MVWVEQLRSSIDIYVYIFNTSKYFEMSLIALFSCQVTKDIDNIFCCLHLVVSVNIFSQKIPLKAGYNFSPSGIE